MTSRSDSGSSASPRLVEPLRSEKTIVTVLRTSCGGRLGASAVPQNPHRRNLAGFSSPQFGQTTSSMPIESSDHVALSSAYDAGMVSPAADLALAREALHSCPLFADLDDATLVLCADAMRGRRFRRGEVVFHVEDPGDALFVVTSGEIKIVLPSEEGSEPVILTTIGRGGFFGELALLDGRPRSASAVAVRAVEALVLRRDAFDRLVDAEPALRR